MQISQTRNVMGFLKRLLYISLIFSITTASGLKIKSKFNMWNIYHSLFNMSYLTEQIKTLELASHNITLSKNSYLFYKLDAAIMHINLHFVVPGLTMQTTQLPVEHTMKRPEMQKAELPKTQTQKLLYRQPRTDKIPIRKVSDYNITGPIESLSEIPGYDENQLLNEKKE